ncbi:scaffolding protein [Paenibacillus sp. YN15]|uniref:phage scaffolding protein n=1 Tax=Paenibacillus sp. YN15 TaxID=1742774 RepID=UPI000DCD9C65|nr:scaffolding protein [Paenibacillus sp. YN15]RAU96833.1 scaffolding protein [Paenibacillus sp. YN15]
MRTFLNAQFSDRFMPLFNPEPTPAPTDPNPQPDPDPKPEKTFTQAELDALIADRLGRERKKYADYDELKTKLTALEQAEEERKKTQMSEQERLQAERDEALRKASEAEASVSAKVTAANQRLISAEFRTLAREANVPADRIAAALKLADLSGADVDDEGNVSGVKEAVEALVAANPYLAEKTQPKPIGGAGGGGEPTDKTKEQLLKEAAEKARRTGRIEDRMAYSALKDELNR